MQSDPDAAYELFLFLTTWEFLDDLEDFELPQVGLKPFHVALTMISPSAPTLSWRASVSVARRGGQTSANRVPVHIHGLQHSTLHR